MSQSPEDVTAGVHQLIPILGQMGATVTEFAPGRVAARLPFAPNANHFGAAYAGSLFSALEFVAGVIALSTFSETGAVPIAKSLTIDFLKPAREDVTVVLEIADDEVARISAEVAENGRATFLTDVQAVTDDGAVVARVRGEYQLRRIVEGRLV